MRILVLNGSPHTSGATSDMVSAFSTGAMEAGHEVISIDVAHKNIKGCMVCECCREKEKGLRRLLVFGEVLLQPLSLNINC